MLAGSKITFSLILFHLLTRFGNVALNMPMLDFVFSCQIVLPFTQF